MSFDVLIVRTGTANIASISAAFKRLGANITLGGSKEDIERAERIVLPGVGAFAAAMQKLSVSGVASALKEYISEGKPLLAICLGLQLLCESSEESPNVKGLSVIKSEVTKFNEGVRIPQLGWNSILVESDCAYLKPGCAYFANSYRLEKAPDGWRAAYSVYGGKFVAALERGNILACQFHPELSGNYGLDLIRRWLADGGKE
ncbi:MAG: imidazole glycerol phosphate synthase subunit HisH [Myxococcota bacterium]